MQLQLPEKKGRTIALLLLLVLPVVMIAGCSSSKSVQSKTAAIKAGTPETLCKCTVKYFIEKLLITMSNGQEKEDNKAVEIMVNPRDSQLSMITVQQEEHDPMELKTKSCNLAAGMISGQAEYEIISERRLENGTTATTRVKMLVEASNGAVAISLSDQLKPGGMKAVVSRWEVVDDSNKEKTEAKKPATINGEWRVDVSKKIFSHDSIVKNGYTLQFYVQSPNFDSTVKRRMIETFFTVYPKQVERFNTQAPKNVLFIIDPTYKGIAAALGNVVRYNPDWFAQNPEDIDVVTHEVMHVVQGYNYATVPFWVTEGIADYARAVFGVNNENAKWELLKPVAQSHFQDGYKITARFFVWLEEQYKMEFVKELNGIAAARSYTNAFWTAKFGKAVEELWDEYRTANDLEPQPPPMQMVTFIRKSQALDSLLKVYATRDSLVKSKFEVTGEFVYPPNVVLPPGYPEGSRDKIFWYRHPVFATRRHTLINQTVESALKFAYSDLKMVAVYDSAKLFPALDAAVFKKRYCFDIIVPKEQEDSIDNIFVAKISNHFNLSTRIDTIEQTVLVLKKVEGFVFTKPDPKLIQDKTAHELFVQGIMEPYILIGNYLDSYTDLPVIDETGLKDAYDFGIRSDDEIVLRGTESKEVAERLKKHGLRLERTVRKYPALVITR